MKSAQEKQAEREANPEYQAIDTSKMVLVIKEGRANVGSARKGPKVARIVGTVITYAFLLFMSLIVSSRSTG
jgi:hypothetical protein